MGCAAGDGMEVEAPAEASAEELRMEGDPLQSANIMHVAFEVRGARMCAQSMLHASALEQTPACMLAALQAAS